MTETLAHRYSSERTQREPSNEYQHDMVKMFFQTFLGACALKKVASALEVLNANGATFREIFSLKARGGMWRVVLYLYSLHQLI